MRLFLNKTVLCFLVLLCSVASAAEKLGFVTGEVLIRYKKTMSIAAASTRLEKDGLIFLNKVENPKKPRNYDFIHARVSRNETVEEAVRRLSQDPGVESVQPNFKYQILQTTPNDPYFNMQWGLKNTAQDVVDFDITGPSFPSSEGIPAVSGKDMNLTVAWDAVKNCDTVTVAVIDSGVKYDHEDLAANMWDDPDGIHLNHGYDTFNSDDNPMDDNGHGTHVAGTIGAVGNNAKGTTGVCWTVKLMAVKVMNAAGNGTSASIATGINWAVSHNAHVINMSIGGDNTDAALLAAIRSARDADIVVVSAAGNDGTNNTSTAKYPCNHREENTICVAATGQNNRLASFSNFSTTYVDVGAPGINIISAWPTTRLDQDVPFATGWTNTNTNSAWLARTIGTPAVDAVTVPANWDYSTTYVDDSDARIHQSFNFTTESQVFLQFNMLSNLAAGDFLKTYVKPGIVDPFTGGTLDTITSADNTAGYADLNIFDVSTACAGRDCSVGFQFVSDVATVSTGALIHSMKLVSYKTGTTGYNMIRGTSMATPHVSGLAALLRARNPNYKAPDVVYAIKNGGIINTFLSGKTTTGKSVSATGSLSLIRAPTGVTAVQD